ncbi:MAG: helix-turn-helix transcriptional regulator [Planctomycetes bacterium]|nr:helix-turn-helix transcriptional regulator [Planctomycetota bacterium]
MTSNPPTRASWPLQQIEKLSFGLCAETPVKLIHHRWPDRRRFWYDMHYPFELGIVLTGRMRRQYQNAEQDIGQGQVWLCNIWEPHGFRILQAPCEAVILMILPPMLTATCYEESKDIQWRAPFCVQPHKRPQARTAAARRSILNVARELADPALADKPRVWLRLKLTQALLILFEDWSPQKPPSVAQSSTAMDRVNRAIQMVFESASAVRTEAAASACGMNRNTFAGLFYKTMGLRFSDFGLRFRLSSAAAELRKTATPAKAIALKWGFADISHMHHWFIRCYGLSPSQYRKAVE